MKQKVALALSVVLAVLGGVAALAQADLSAAYGETQAGEAGGDGLAAASVLHITGASFVPESSATVFLADGNGAVAVTGSSGRYMHAPVLLPDGAQVSGLTFYYYDNQNSDTMTARLIRNNDPGIGFRTVLAEASSPVGVAGYSSAYGSVGPTPIVIDNARYNYEIEVSWTVGSSNLKLTSIKVFYTTP